MKKRALILIILGIFILILLAFLFLAGPKSDKDLSDKNLENNTKTSKIVVIPASIEENCIGFVIGSPDEIKLVSEIGGAWARPHPGPFAWGFIETEKVKFDFSMTDDYVLSGQEKNVALLATIWPFADWDQKTCHSQECEVSTQDIFYPEDKMGWKNGIPKSRCAPCNYEDYQSFIAKLVERYDGDGIDDMPGLVMPIKYWEVLNEPEMGSDEMTFYKGTKDEYVQIFTKTKETIKEECTDCKVLHGGAAGVQPFMLEYWGKIFDAKINFDIANIHYIGGSDLSTLNVRDFKQLLTQKAINKPIWITEVEYRNSSEIVSSVDGALNAGASKIFFTQFEVGHFGLPLGGKYSEEYRDIALKCK
jgi:hypothetical protein